ncbi:hypothetical protein B0H12DRAFT_1127396 [Mycena haematopus]|nr:hypothetical protein B0H12DRAFT_1127396 [Mycena haematopus]
MNAAQIQTQLNSNAYIDLVSFSILFYDFFLTLDWEIARYWGTPLTWPNALFFANRYGTLLGNIPVVMEYFWSEESSAHKIKICLGLESYHQYFIIVTQLIVAVMLMLRTYALYERSKRVLAWMILVASGAVAVGIWTVISGKAVDQSTNLPLYFGCNYPTSRAQGLSLAAAWAGVAVFDCMIFLLTLSRVFSARRNSTILTILLRDGSIYFGVMVLSNLSNILTFVFGTEYTRGIATTFTNIISSVMLSHLMFNLRDPKLAHMAGRSTSFSFVPHEIRFAEVRPRDGTGCENDPELDSDAMIDIELTNRRAGPGMSHPLVEAGAGMA